MTGALSVGRARIPMARWISRVLVSRAAGAKLTRLSRFRPVGGEISSGGCVNLRRSDSVHVGGVAFFALLAVFPGIAAIVSMYGLFADVSRIGEHVSVLAGLLPGGVLDLIADQITLISRKGSQALGMAFVAGLLISLGSANSGVAALFDALNVVYGEREKRSLVGLYTTTFLFTLAGIFSVIVAITGVVVLPVMLKFVGLSTTTEWLLAILRWPVLFVTIVVGLACIYRYGPSRRDARWRWVTWGSILAEFLWIFSSMLFSWYVATFDSYNRIYGSLGAAVGFMVWLWISTVIVLLEASSTRRWSTKPHATRRKAARGLWAQGAR